MNSNAYKQTSFKIGSNALASMDIVFKQLNGLNNQRFKIIDEDTPANSEDGGSRNTNELRKPPKLISG